MNCRRVEKLIPLYVEGDLPSRSSELIASHLEWCGQCNWLADEFMESQGWLRSTEPPAFDEAFLDRFKADALNLIAASARPSRLSSLMQQWTSPKQVFALAVAVVIFAGVVMFYAHQANPGAWVQVADSTETQDQEGSPSPASQHDRDREHETGMATGAGLREPHHAKNRVHARTSGGRPLVSKQTIELLPTEIGPQEGPGYFSMEPSVESVASSNDAPPMLRIEMQTSDPNIRIIWFAPREVERPKTNQ